MRYYTQLLNNRSLSLSIGMEFESGWTQLDIFLDARLLNRHLPNSDI